MDVASGEGDGAMDANKIKRTLAMAQSLKGAIDKTSKTVGKPGAIVGQHVAGPTRGNSVVVLPEGTDELLANVIELLTAQLDGAVAADPSPAAGATPTGLGGQLKPKAGGELSNRFKRLEFGDD